MILPRYLISKENHLWVIWDTVEHKIVEQWNTKEEAVTRLPHFLKLS